MSGADRDSVTRTTCPYVGPQPYVEAQHDLFYGRAADTTRFLNQVLADRLVLLHSPSGAGKTSLVNASLTPKLRKRGFTIWGRLRVKRPERRGSSAHDSYVQAVLKSLNESPAAKREFPPDQLSSMSLPEFFKAQAAEDGAPRPHDLLFFDQFEEILADVSESAAAARAAFFEQVGEVLQDPRRHAIFAIREEHIGALDPYLHWLPHGLSSRFRLELLGAEAAREAIVEPVAKPGPGVEVEAAEAIVADLRRIQVRGPDGAPAEVKGQYVEPVHLQLVCLRLWEEHLRHGRAVTKAELTRAPESTDDALMEYYEKSVKDIAGKASVDEGVVRSWLERTLIVAGKVRGDVLKGAQETEGLANGAIRMLVDAYLVREETRHGNEWYEITHDRFVKPMVRSNEKWFEAAPPTFERCAETWARAGRPDALLVSGAMLEEGVRRPANTLSEVQRVFLERSLEARKRSRANRTLLGALILLLVVVIASNVRLAIDRANESAKTANDALEFRNRHERRQRAAQVAVEIEKARFSLHLASSVQTMSLSDVTLFESLDTWTRSSTILLDNGGAEDRPLIRRALASAATSVLTRQISRGSDVDMVSAPSSGAILARAYFPLAWRSEVVRWDVNLANDPLRRLIRVAEALTYSPDLTRVLAREGRRSFVVRDVVAGSIRHPLEFSGGVVPTRETWSRWRSDGQALRFGIDPQPCFDATGGQLPPAECAPQRISSAVRPGTRGAVLANEPLWDSSRRRPLLLPADQANHALPPSPLINVSRRLFAYAQQGAVLALSDGSTIRTFNVDAAGRVTPLHARLDGSTEPKSMDILPDGSRLATVERGHGARIWDLISGRVLNRLPRVGWSSAQSVAFAADGRRVVVGDTEGTIRAWDGVTPGPQVRCLWNSTGFRHDSPPCSAAPGELAIATCLDVPGALVDLVASPTAESFRDARVIEGGRRVVARTGGGVAVWQPGAPDLNWESIDAASASGCDPISGDGSRRLVFKEGAARVEQVSAGREPPIVLGGWSGAARCVALDWRGERVALLGGDGRVYVWSTANPGAPAPRNGVSTSNVEALVLSEDGGTFATSGSDGAVSIWRVGEEHPLVSFVTGGQPPTTPRVQLSPTGAHVLTIDRAGELNLRALPEGRSISLERAPSSDPNSPSTQEAPPYAFSADGRLLVGPLNRRDIALRRTDSGALVRTLEGHEADIRFITLSPDSARLASVASNGEVNLWDLSPGLQENERLSATFRAPERWADFARLLPDGRLLVGGSAGMLIYPTDVDGLLRLARRLRYLLDPQRPGRDDTARCPTLP